MIGPYRVVGALSRGPSAIVYRALDTSHDDRVVALKVFTPALSADAAFRARFRREAGVLSALREPHVVPIHRYGEIDGALYVDMRLVRGRTLADLLGAGPLDPDRARAIAEQIDVATEALRRSGLGDRPLQRSEVLISGSPDRGEFVQLVGLGLGRPPVGGRAVTPANALVGSPSGRTPPPDSPAPPAERTGRLHRPGRPAIAAVLLMACVVLATVILVRGGGESPDRPDAGDGALVATIGGVGGGVVDAETAESDGRRVLVAATADGAIRTWDLRTGEVVRPAIAGDAVAVATTTMDGRIVVVTRDRDTTITMHDLVTGVPVEATVGVPAPAPGSDETFVPVRGGLATAEPAGRPVVVAPQETGVLVPGADGRPAPQIGLRAFSIPDGEPVGPLLSEDGHSIDSFSVTEIEGRPVAVSLTGNGSLQVRDLGTGARIGPSIALQPELLASLTTAQRDGASVAVTGGLDNAVRIWDLRTGEQIGPPLTGHVDSVAGLATVRIGTRTVLISTAGLYPEPRRAETRFWDLATGAPLGPPLVDHPAAGSIVAVAEGEHALLVAAPPDGPVTVWDAQQLIQEEGT